MRVLISGGGTGGHLFPAIAVAQALSQSEPDSTLLYVGRHGGIEEQVVPRSGLAFKTIVAAKLDMEQLWRNWSVPFIVPWALLQSARIVRAFQPDVVLGTGGYVSAPLVLSAAAFRVPVVLQEQNALPGRTTRLLSHVARVVATAYPESARYLHATSVVTGTPVRKEFWQRRTDFPTHPGRLLILGGSQGAHRINEAVAAALPELVGRLGLDVSHQTGQRDFNQMEALKVNLGPPGSRYHPFAFDEDLGPRVHNADLVLSRAGAGAISEVSAVGIPMLLVPGPFAGGHQRLNVEPYEAAGAAVTIPDAECDGPRLVREVSEIVHDPVRYSKMVGAMGSLGRPHAAEQVAALITRITRH
ncbi:MAG: undecaprenyldiphospho-muramoylpentapeptide beta-N-acetylglucosaminyltransferase [Chloroflexi bacterium]|nr:MAG: undecaprenyldiphospho-muramoylpentapeptide beta-N-acetylglucosaminyltransferase [Chloroflexota bacterium]